MGYHNARVGWTGLSTGYISRPMPTTAEPEQAISRTPTLIGVRSVLPSMNACIKDVPNMAVTIWTTNRIPTAVATLLRDLGRLSLDIWADVVLMVVMTCPSNYVRSGFKELVLTMLD
jgi:hypothetical protein